MITMIILGIVIFISLCLAKLFDIENVPMMYPLLTLIGIAFGGGLLSLLYFDIVTILVFVVSIVGLLIITSLIVPAFYPKQHNLDNNN